MSRGEHWWVTSRLRAQSSTPGKQGPSADLWKGLCGVEFRGWETVKVPLGTPAALLFPHGEAESHGRGVSA